MRWIDLTITLKIIPEKMLSISTKLTQTTIITDESTGQVYGYPLDPVDIINIIGDQELTNFAKEDGYLTAVNESGAEIFEEILYEQKWIEKAGIRLHTNMTEGDSPHQCVLGIMLGPKDIDEKVFNKYYDLDLFNLPMYSQSLTPATFFEYMIDENNYKDIIENKIEYHESNNHTSFGWKLIKTTNNNIVDIASMFKYHKITPRVLWDMYFYDLYVEDFERLRDLHDVIDLLYTVQKIDSEIPEIVSAFVANL